MKKIVAINCSLRFAWTMFNPEHKKERHETVFPEDKKKAFILGAEMVSAPWEELK